MVKSAVAEQMPTEPMTCPEKVLWYTLRDIYSNYRRGVITRQKGEELKHKAMRQFDLDNQTVSSAMRILREHALFWQSIEKASAAYRLDRTLENADAFVEAVYKVPVKADDILKEGSV